MIGERIKELREAHGMSRRDMEKATGIAEYTWRAVETEKQQANESHITALANLWPENKIWLVFGESYPEIGQTSPKDTKIEALFDEFVEKQSANLSKLKKLTTKNLNGK